MNPRRVHALMNARFPQVELVTLTWVNILEAHGTIRSDALSALIDEFIHAQDILVEVNRKIGDLKSREQVIPYVQEHVGKGQVRMTGPDFQGYILIGTNDVATGRPSA